MEIKIPSLRVRQLIFSVFLGVFRGEGPSGSLAEKNSTCKTETTDGKEDRDSSAGSVLG